MKKTTFKKMIHFFTLFLFSAIGFSQSTATYTITFNSEWNAENHNNNNSLPSNAHYSKLVGAVHNSDVSYWQTGELASTGLKNIAEIGNNTAFFNQVQNNINAGNTQQYIDGSNLNSATGSITIRIMDISESYPLLTLASMIAPSSDWFVGVNNLSLIDSNGNWRDSITIEMFAYDAGTENDEIDYSFNNTPTNPQQNITSKNNVAPFNNVRIGTLTVSLDSTLGISNNNEITKVSIYPNPSRGKMTIQTSTTNILEEVLVYNVLGKQVASFKNQESSVTSKIDVTHLNKGVYLVRLLLVDGSQSTKKVIIN
jgi:hypothetical protein